MLTWRFKIGWHICSHLIFENLCLEMVLLSTKILSQFYLIVHVLARVRDCTTILVLTHVRDCTFVHLLARVRECTTILVFNRVSDLYLLVCASVLMYIYSLVCADVLVIARVCSYTCARSSVQV
jgi:hypothetical protein